MEKHKKDKKEMVINVCGREWSISKEEVHEGMILSNDGSTSFGPAKIWIAPNTYDNFGIALHEIVHSFDYETGISEITLNMDSEQRAEYVRALIKKILENGFDIFQRLYDFMEENDK